MFAKFEVPSPKRSRHPVTNWDAHFPYYAGFPPAFVGAVIDQAELAREAIVVDPWNGSGTTTAVASELGVPAVGNDLNPVMAIVARARLLAPTEADSLRPLAAKILHRLRPDLLKISVSDPLLQWFDEPSSAVIRAAERRIRTHLLGELTFTAAGVRLDRVSGLAATMYVALFSVCRALIEPFKSSNPTWLRVAKDPALRVAVTRERFVDRYLAMVGEMAISLASQASSQCADRAKVELLIGDSTDLQIRSSSIDLVITSPPYCTRIDYTSATRVELAIMRPLLVSTPGDLSRAMLGSVRVPVADVPTSGDWGDTCLNFLKAVEAHTSKASSGYYLKTHSDYFDKLSRSIRSISRILKDNGRAVIVVQDSRYKEIHNDLPRIVEEMGGMSGLRLFHRVDFHLGHSMANVNPRARANQGSSRPVEAVLCLEKQGPSK